MSHQHYCKVCKIPVAICDGDSCVQDTEEHYCSIHHPDPQHRVEVQPPPNKANRKAI